MKYSNYSGPRRGETASTVILPAWAVGDFVRHRVTGVSGKLTDMMTQGGELWKLLPTGAKKHLVVHARDLQLEPRP